MDTKERYRECEVGVRLVPGRHGDYEHERSWNVPERGLGGLPEVRRCPRHGAEPIPVDGWATFFWPDRPADEPHMAYAFPFRDHRKCERWFCDESDEQGKRGPVWVWKNPEEPLSELTLHPSLGIGVPPTFHCHVRGGAVDWL